jgi:3-hydroxybutyryl-CoA dehydrogenase
MKIGVIGELTRFEELKQTLPGDASITYDENSIDPSEGFDFIFDLSFDDNLSPSNLFESASPDTIFLLSSALIELQCLDWQTPISQRIFGMNCLPSFINRPVKEISYHSEEQKQLIGDIAQKLNWDIAPVKDRVGMVTPRILFMIINEAYYTLQEGTASRSDIDTGMKLGTNYPYGPFEWCGKIGLKTVVKMLQHLYDDTKDERYKICSLLKTESYQ